MKVSKIRKRPRYIRKSHLARQEEILRKVLEGSEEAWLKIERYLEKNTDAQISHGICDDCMEKLYGDQPWFQKKQQ